MDHKIIEELARRAKDLIFETAEEAEEAALDMMERNADDSDKPLKAKMAVSMEWEAGSKTPKMKVEVSYSTKVKRTIDERFFADQTHFDFSDSGIDKATMKVGDGPEVTVFERKAADA